MTDSHANPASSRRPELEIQSYAYPEMPWQNDLHGWSHAFGRETLNATDPRAAKNGGEGVGDGHAAGNSAQPAAPQSSAGQRADAEQRAEIDAQWLQRLGEETRQAAEKGRREGFAMGLERGREESAGTSRELREQFLDQGTTLASVFAEERAHYFHQAEEELVRLALAVAARILRREAQMDPLLLTGAVRVALGQLAQTTAVRLHVPEADRPLWEEAFAKLPNLAHRPEVVGEAAMELGECRVETELGSANLSLWAQLKEIERGFFDRVGASGSSVAQPGARSSRPSRPSAPPIADAEPVGASASRPVAAPITESAENSENAMAAMYNEREW